MSHLLLSKRGHDSDDDEEAEYSHSDLTDDDIDEQDYTDNDSEQDYTDNDSDNYTEEESDNEQPGIETETGKVQVDEAVYMAKEEPLEQIDYQDLKQTNEEEKQKRIQEHRDYRRKLAEDPSFVPYVGLFWGHDNRYREDSLKDTRSTVESKPRFSNQTASNSSSIKDGKQYDRNLDPLMYKKWDHSGYEELLRLEEEDERRKRDEPTEQTEEGSSNKNYYRQHPRNRRYNDSSNYHKQQDYKSRPRRNRNQQEDWPELSTSKQRSSPKIDSNLDLTNSKNISENVKTEESKQLENSSDNQTNQVSKDSQSTDLVGVNQNSTNNLGNKVSKDTQVTIIEDSGETKSDETTKDDWGTLDQNPTETDDTWGPIDNTAVKNLEGWGDIENKTITDKKSFDNKKDRWNSSPSQDNQQRNFKNNNYKNNNPSSTFNKKPYRSNYSSTNKLQNIPVEEKASPSWDNTDFSTSKSPRKSYAPRPKNDGFRKQTQHIPQERKYNNRSNEGYRKSNSRNNYQTGKKEEADLGWDSNSIIQNQGWANSSTPVVAVENNDWDNPTANDNGWGNPSDNPTANDNGWANPSNTSVIKGEGWDVPSETTAIKGEGWDTSPKDVVTESTQKSSPSKKNNISSSGQEGFNKSKNSNETTKNKKTKKPVAVESKEETATAAKQVTEVKESSSTKGQVASDNWSSIQTHVKEDSKTSEVPTANLSENKPLKEHSDHIPKETLTFTKTKETARSTWTNQHKNETHVQSADYPKKSRGYLSQKLKSTPNPPINVKKDEPEETIIQKVEERYEQSAWGTFRNTGDEDSDVEIILEADEESEWIKGEQVLGMTAPQEPEQTSSKGNTDFPEKSSPRTSSKTNYRSHEGSPRSTAQHKMNGARKPNRRNFDENWRQRDEKDDSYRNNVPVYYPPQPHGSNIAFVPMIPGANGNPMYAMPIAMGTPPNGANNGGSISPNHGSDGSNTSPHPNFYNGPAMIAPNGVNGIQLPPGYEANGMVYYGVDPSAMYAHQPFYYYAVPMANSSNNENGSPLYSEEHTKREANPSHMEEEGWGPSPELDEAEEGWTKSSPSNDKSRNPRPVNYNTPYYYYPPQNPY